MKRTSVLVMLFLSLAIFFKVQAQDVNECMQDLSIFAEFAKVKNYKSAYEPWIRVRKECPSINVAIFSYGERILKDFIKNGTPQEVETSKSDLILLYDDWIKYFPNKRNKSVLGNVLSSKAQALLDYKMADLKVIYSTFDEAFKKNPESFTNPKLLYNYFKTLYNRYKAGDQEVSTELLFDKYA